MALNNFKPAYQCQMAVWIGAVNIFSERVFETGLAEPFPELFELIRRPHLGHTEYVRVNFLDDPNKRVLFTFRLGLKHSSSPLSPVHFKIILDVVVSEGNRLLSESISRQPDKRYSAKPEELPQRHDKDPKPCR